MTTIATVVEQGSDASLVSVVGADLSQIRKSSLFDLDSDYCGDDCADNCELKFPFLERLFTIRKKPLLNDHFNPDYLLPSSTQLQSYNYHDHPDQVRHSL